MVCTILNTVRCVHSKMRKIAAECDENLVVCCCRNLFGIIMNGQVKLQYMMSYVEFGWASDFIIPVFVLGTARKGHAVRQK